MSTAYPPCPHPGEWKSLYRAAILETDRELVPQKVFEAEQAVLARGRELFYLAATSEEAEALEDALYALRAFRSAWEHNHDEGESRAAAA